MIASIVANTSLTLRDIEEMRIPQLEGLLDGLSENAEEMERELKRGGKGKSRAASKYKGDAAIDELLKIAK